MSGGVTKLDWCTGLSDWDRPEGWMRSGGHTDWDGMQGISVPPKPEVEDSIDRIPRIGQDTWCGTWAKSEDCEGRRWGRLGGQYPTWAEVQLRTPGCVWRLVIAQAESDQEDTGH